MQSDGPSAAVAVRPVFILPVVGGLVVARGACGRRRRRTDVRPPVVHAPRQSSGSRRTPRTLTHKRARTPLAASARQQVVHRDANRRTRATEFP